jgi:hypothetical protein
MIMNSDLTRRSSLILAAGLAGLAAGKGGTAHAAAPGFATLDENAEPLRDDFNRDVGHVRLLLLVDPICPTCLLGLSNIDQDLLSKLPRNTALRTYVVHEPVIGGTARNIPGAAGLVHAPVRHYWNPTGSFGRLAGAAFDLHRDGKPVYAWDVWTIHGPDAVWKAAGPPMPRVLMHQLSAMAGDRRFSHLDSKKFASDTLALLGSASNTAVS